MRIVQIFVFFYFHRKAVWLPRMNAKVFLLFFFQTILLISFGALVTIAVKKWLKNDIGSRKHTQRDNFFLPSITICPQKVYSEEEFSPLENDDHSITEYINGIVGHLRDKIDVTILVDVSYKPNPE